MVKRIYKRGTRAHLQKEIPDQLQTIRALRGYCSEGKEKVVPNLVAYFDIVPAHCSGLFWRRLKL